MANVYTTCAPEAILLHHLLRLMSHQAFGAAWKWNTRLAAAILAALRGTCLALHYI